MPVIHGEIVCYRWWRVWAQPHPRLAAISRHVPWAAGTNRFHCVRNWTRAGDRWGLARYAALLAPAHHTPHASCHCGLHALHRPHVTEPGIPPQPMIVHGAIQAWGEVEAHRDGFRAEYARIVALTVDPCELTPPSVVRAVAGAYRVPVVPWEVLPSVALEHGRRLPAPAYASVSG
jgi:hypothetical protein